MYFLIHNELFGTPQTTDELGDNYEFQPEFYILGFNNRVVAWRDFC